MFAFAEIHYRIRDQGQSTIPSTVIFRKSTRGRLLSLEKERTEQKKNFHFLKQKLFSFCIYLFFFLT